MSGNIDERIVEMTFRGTSFASGVKNAVISLDELKRGLNGLKGSENDINNLDAAGRRFSLKGMANGVSSLAGHFTSLGVIGVTALATITQRAVSAGISLVKALTIDPIKAGFDIYETKINAIKTVLANTAAAGTTLKQVTAALAQLNQYANLTVYNFGQMAHNVGTFTAAGVGLKDSVASIKGIANLAALSGSSADQASNAMYQLSQAIAAGRVKLQDWNSVVNAGLGGKVFQNQLVETARAAGVNIDAIVKKAGGFRNSLQQGWLSSKILVDTLKTFTGDLSAQQLKAMGFTAQETTAILKQGKTALQSATQIKTVSQLTQALKEEVATAWAGVWEAIIGNSTQAVSTLSAVHNAAENFLTNPIKSLARILQSFTDLGGRAVVIKSLENVFKSLGAILHVVGQAFREVFPSTGGGAVNGLLAMAKAFERFTAALIPSKRTLGDLKDIFAGLFSVVKIVIDVVLALFGGLTKLGGAGAHAGGGFLGLIASLGRFITSIRKAIESGTGLQTFFSTLGSIIAFPIRIIGDLISKLTGVGGAFSKGTAGAESFVQKIGDLFRKLASFIGQGINSGSFSALSTLLNHLLVGSILLTVKNFFSGFAKASGGGAGVFATLKESLEGLTNTFKVFQDKLKSDILEKIAIAIALLAAALLVLSLIPFPNLTRAIGAITIMFAELMAAMDVMVKIAGGGGILKMISVGIALNLLSTALVILAGAVAILAQFSWEQLAKGLASIAILLTELVLATLLMSADSKGLITSSIAMNAMAIALNLLALAVKQLGSMNVSTLVKGIGSIGVLLLLLGAFNKLGGKGLISTATSMILVGVALNVIERAVSKLGSLSVDTLAKGLISIAAALGIIAVAMMLMPPSTLASAASLVIVAGALLILGEVMSIMGGMSWTEIAKSLIVLAGSLAIIAGAMYLMVGALPGAAALIIIAASLAILTPILLVLGTMSWGAILAGLGALAGIFVVLAAGGLLLTPVIPVLIGLGVAVGLFGAGILLAGAGVALFGVGIAALAAAVTLSGAAIIGFVAGILSLIPLAFKKIGQGIAAFAGAIAAGSVGITKAFVAIMTALLDAIIKIVPLAAKAFDKVLVALLGIIGKDAPRIINTWLNLLQDLLNAVRSHLPRFISAGVSIIIALLNGIANNISRIARAGTNAAISFINAVGSSAQRIAAAGIHMVISLVNGVANQIRASSGAMNAAGRNLASAIIEGMVSGILGGIGGIVSAAAGVARSALSAAKSALGIHSPSKEFEKVGAAVGDGLVLGLTGSTGNVTKSVKAVGNSMIDALGQTLAGLSDTVNSNMDLQPRITPVLDLTQAKKGFSDLAGLSKAQLIAATASTVSATSISAANAAAAKAAGLVSTGGTNLTFNQVNNSPEALSAATIYRKTKNQLSIAKGALASANSG